MADLVPEVTQQRPVGLMHREADVLATRIVGLGDVEGDDALVVARQNPLLGVHLLEKLEGQPIDGILQLVGRGQDEFDQRVEEATLGLFERRPVAVVFRLRQFGNGVRRAAGKAMMV